MYTRELTILEEAEIISLFKEGLDKNGIMSIVKRSKSTVNRVIRRYAKSETSHQVVNQIKIRTEEDYDFSEINNPQIVPEFECWDI